MAILEENKWIKKPKYNGLKINIIRKDIYKEYESYDIKVENTTENTILLDSGERVDSIYLMGANQSHYNAYSYEMDKTRITLKPEETKTITIRFNKLYSNQTVMEAMVFEDIILDYEAYKALENKTEYTNREKCSIEI